jgi:murein L,D-transpeptidase YcbB/YkuD
MYGFSRTLTLLMVGALSMASAARAENCVPPGEAPPAAIEGEMLDSAALAAFYAVSTGACAWDSDAAANLVVALQSLPEQAVDSSSFHAAAIARHGADAERDLLLTDAALRYARVMSLGQVAPGDVDEDWEFPLAKIDQAAALHTALDGHAVGAWLAGLPPDAPAYHALIGLLARYRALALAGAWPLVPAGPSLHPGESDPRVPILRTRLGAEGDLVDAPAVATNQYDATTVTALKRFQTRHGIKPDGVLGASTLAALNVTVAARIDQIAANLERWRWMARAIPDSRIEVNIATQTLSLVSDGETEMAMRTVVGDAKHWTPLLVATASSFLLNPPWKVPTSIIMKEIRPKLRREPDYLEKNDMQWIGDQLVQAPGPKNSLGQIKLEVHDRFDVYLHDTPMRSAFTRDNRALSHGCVRLERPLDLATSLLSAKPGWAREDFDAAIATGATSRVFLPKPITVVLSYWTVEAAADGTPFFYDDLYGRDARLAARLGHGWMTQPEVATGEKDKSSVAGHA